MLASCQIDLGGPSAPLDEVASTPPGTGAIPGTPATPGAPTASGTSGATGTSGAVPIPAAAGVIDAANDGIPIDGASMAGSTPSSPASPGAASPDCDLEGRWLVVQRDGISVPSPRVDQAIQAWLYYEVQQEGSAVRVVKGLDCGYRVLPLPPPPAPTLAATGDASAAWAGILANDTHTGRTGSYTSEGSGCRLHFGDEFSIRGATASFYSDPSRPLPAPGSSAATPSAPGWEDWDGDGNPGITVRVESVLVRGQVHVVSRERSVYDGVTPPNAELFKVPVRWTIEQSTLATTPPNDAFLANSGLANADPSSHFAYFLALEGEQGTGTDTEICDEMRALATSLPADANQ